MWISIVHIAERRGGMQKIFTWLKKEKQSFGILLRSVPATVVTLLVVSVISMNLLANKTLLQLDWIALDGGILISWLCFMCMDMVTKHFGPKTVTWSRHPCADGQLPRR